MAWFSTLLNENDFNKVEQQFTDWPKNEKNENIKFHSSEQAITSMGIDFAHEKFAKWLNSKTEKKETHGHLT